MRREYIGRHYTTNEGYEVVIIDYSGKEKVLVKFIYNGYIRYTTLANLRKGAVGNPYNKNQFGGYMGEGPYKENSANRLYHTTWYSMLTRANMVFESTSDKYYDDYRTYEFTTICDEWYNFQNFASWYEYNLSLLNPKYRYQMDKDIYQWGQQYTIYSPQTCCLVPRSLNVALEGLHEIRENGLPLGVNRTSGGKYMAACSYGDVSTNSKYIGSADTPMEAFKLYKAEKERYLRQLADFYLTECAILPETRDAVYRINIEPYNKFFEK